MPSKKLSKNSILAYDTAGNFASPTWRSIKSAKGLTVNRAPSTIIDTSNRFVDVETKKASRLKVSVDADFIWNAGTAQTLLRTAFLAGSAIDLGVFDGPAGSTPRGLRGEWLLTKWALEWSLGSEQKLSTTLMPHGNYTAGQSVAYADGGAAGTADTAANNKLGKDAICAVANGTAITGIRDMKLNLEHITEDASDRGCNFDCYVPTRMKIGAEVTYVEDSSVAAIVAFRTAHEAGSALDLWLLDGPYATTGSWGVHSDWVITGFNKAGELNGLQLITCQLEPAGDYTTAATFVTIS